MSTDAQNQSATAQTVTTESSTSSLLDQVLQAGRVRDQEQRAYHTDLVGELVEEIMKGQMKVSANTEAMLDSRIAEIDRILSDQLNAIMHTEDFQKLEASWRGLHYLVHESETGTMLQIRVLNASKKDLLRDMEKASEFDQTPCSRRSTPTNTTSSVARPTAP